MSVTLSPPDSTHSHRGVEEIGSEMRLLCLKTRIWVSGGKIILPEAEAVLHVRPLQNPLPHA
jgi:hypothetical protein